MANVDDNKLVTSNDLVITQKEEITWTSDLLQQLADKIEEIGNVPMAVVVEEEEVVVTYPKMVIIQAISQVLGQMGLSKSGWSNYELFEESVDWIIPHQKGKKHQRPWTYFLAKDQKTNVQDFWVMQTFVNTEGNFEYEDETYNKFEVFTSQQFDKYLHKYCDETLKDEVQYWIFSKNLEGYKKLNESHLMERDTRLIQQMFGKVDYENLIVFRFKKKVPKTATKTITKIEKPLNGKNGKPLNGKPLNNGKKPPIIDESDESNGSKSE